MNTQEVANRLVELCRSGQYTQAQEELYADNVVSIEPPGAPSGERVEGMDGIRMKAEQWESMVEEVHGAEVSDPIVAGDHFSLTMRNDVTFKGMGRSMVEEVCVYQVQDGKVVQEQFFYQPGS